MFMNFVKFPRGTAPPSALSSDFPGVVYYYYFYFFFFLYYFFSAPIRAQFTLAPVIGGVRRRAKFSSNFRDRGGGKGRTRDLERGRVAEKKTTRRIRSGKTRNPISFFMYNIFYNNNIMYISLPIVPARVCTLRYRSLVV